MATGIFKSVQKSTTFTASTLKFINKGFQKEINSFNKIVYLHNLVSTVNIIDIYMLFTTL